MEVYYSIFSLLFLSCIFEFSSIHIKKNVVFIWCIFFTIFGGIRWKLGGDWDQYFYHFSHSEWYNIFDYDRYGDGRETLEPAFVFINVLIKSIFGEYFYIYNIIICSFVQYTYYKLSFKFVPQYPILTYSYLMINSSNYFPVRAGLALVIAYWAYKYIKERKLLKFSTILLIASLIHNQCIVLFPFYWLCKIRFDYLKFNLLYFGCVLFGYLFQDYIALISPLIGGDIGEKIHHYTIFETEGKVGLGNMTLMLNFILINIYLYYRNNVKNIDISWTNSLITMTIAHSCIFIIFSSGMGDIARIATLLLPAKAFLFVQVFTHYARSKSNVYSVFALFFIIAFMCYRIYKINEWYYFEEVNIPYKTIFDYKAWLFLQN